MLKNTLVLCFIILNLTVNLFAAKDDLLTFDDKVTLYIYKNGADPFNPILKKVNFKTLKVELSKFIQSEALKEQKRADYIIKNNIMITPQNDDSHYRVTIELRNAKTKNFVRLNYGFTETLLNVDEAVNNSKGGKLLIAYLQGILVKKNKKEINKKNSLIALLF